jgi:hypothetical protein
MLVNVFDVFKAAKGNNKNHTRKKNFVRLDVSLLCFIIEINFIAFLMNKKLNWRG